MNIRKAIKNNLALKIISVFISILLWLYVYFVFGAKTTKIALIQVQMEGLNSTYYAVLNPAHVNVTFSAPIQIIEQFEKNIRATMDLSNIGPGTYNRKPKLIFPKEIEIISMEPATLEVKVEKIVTQDFKVKPIIKGKLSSGNIIGEITLSPDKISLQGTEAILQTIKSVAIEIDITNAQSDLFGYAEVKLTDSQGKVVEETTSNTKMIKFHVPIISSDVTKTVPVIPNLVGSTSRSIKSLSITPQLITIRGSVASLEKIQSVLSEAIDLNDLTDNYNREIQIILPEGIKRENPNEKIIMQIVSEEVITITYTDVKIQLKNLNSSLKATLSRETGTVVITGRKDLINLIKNSVLFADCKDLQKGIHEVDLIFSDIPKGLLVQIIPKKIEIKILD